MEEMILEPQRLTNTRIKVRRLGYIIIITKLLRNNPMKEDKIIEKLEAWASDERNKYSLKIYCGSTLNLSFDDRRIPGIIEYSKTHNSAKRYIETAKELGIIAKVTNKTYSTKLGDVLAVLPSLENPFELSINQICFFLKLILWKDYDYLIALSKCEGDYSKFQKIVKNRFRKKYDIASNISIKLKIKKALKNMEWKKSPKKYFDENVKFARMDWLRDLRTNNLIINFLKKDFICKKWLNNEYYKIFYDVYLKTDIIKWNKVMEQDRKEIIIKYLDESYKKFGSIYSKKI